MYYWFAPRFPAVRLLDLGCCASHSRFLKSAADAAASSGGHTRGRGGSSGGSCGAFVATVVHLASFVAATGGGGGGAASCWGRAGQQAVRDGVVSRGAAPRADFP